MEMLNDAVTVEQEKIIASVARAAIRNCPCYGHLCGYCEDAITVLKMCGHPGRVLGDKSTLFGGLF
jgi:hypothetical protein